MWPLLLFGLVGKGSDYVSGLVVTTLFTDENAFAIFRYGARELPLATALVGGLYTAMVPEVAKNLSQALPLLKQKSF